MDGTDQTQSNTDSARQSTLAEFLLARIDEDEAAARAAGGEFWYPAVVPGDSMRKDPDGPTRTVIDSPSSLITYEVCTDEMASHIIRWDPEHVLAECEAKRLLIERVGNPDWAGFRILAMPYTDHPDFRQEWKP